MAVGQLCSARLAHSLSVLVGQRSQMPTGRSDAVRERLPEVVEPRSRAYVSAPLTTSLQPGGLEPLGDVALAGPGGLALALYVRLDLPHRGPEDPEHRHPAAAMSHMQRGHVPPGRVTRAISRTPGRDRHEPDDQRGHGASKYPSGHGSASAIPSRTSAPGWRSRQADTNCGAGSIAATFSARPAGTARLVRPPGPQPTSSTRIPSRHAGLSASAAASVSV